MTKFIPSPTRYRFTELLTERSWYAPENSNLLDIVSYFGGYVGNSYCFILFVFIEAAFAVMFLYFLVALIKKKKPSKLWILSCPAAIALAIYAFSVTIFVADTTNRSHSSAHELKIISHQPLKYMRFVPCSPVSHEVLSDLIKTEELCDNSRCFDFADPILFEGVSRVMNRDGEYFAVMRKDGGTLKKGIYLRFRDKKRFCNQKHLINALCSAESKQKDKELEGECPIGF